MTSSNTPLVPGDLLQLRVPLRLARLGGPRRVSLHEDQEEPAVLHAFGRIRAHHHNPEYRGEHEHGHTYTQEGAGPQSQHVLAREEDAECKRKCVKLCRTS